MSNEENNAMHCNTEKSFYKFREEGKTTMNGAADDS